MENRKIIGKTNGEDVVDQRGVEEEEAKVKMVILY